jgi:hypothetical protein
MGVPTITVVSAAFAPLAQVTAEGIGHFTLPFVVVPHPVGDRDASLIEKRGAAIAALCVHALTTPAEVLAREVNEHPFPLPDAVMPR